MGAHVPAGAGKRTRYYTDRPFWLTPHGGDMNSAWLCYGERAKLDEWRRTDEFEAWVFRASTCMEGLGVVPGVNFAAARETMERRNRAIGK